jgi:glutathione peroxidase
MYWVAFGVLACVVLIVGIAFWRRAPELNFPPGQTALDFTVKDISGHDVDLRRYRGKVVLVVNVASKCGFTPQYEQLNEIYKKYRDRGFVVLGFPSNDFLRQEPGTDQQIQEFCRVNFGVEFDLFSKIPVTGRDKAPLYAFLTSKKYDPRFAGSIKWNFTKFLLDREGRVVARFSPATRPDRPEVVRAIEAALDTQAG